MVSFGIIDWAYSFLLIVILVGVSLFLFFIFGIFFIISPKVACLALRNIFSKVLFFCWSLVGFEIEIVGLENMPKERCVIAPNHSVLDPILIPLINQNITFVMDRGAAQFFCLLHHDSIRIDKNAKNPNFLANTIEVFKSRSICIYPEGEFVPYGQKYPYHRGVAILARELKCKVVPITHNMAQVFSGNKLRMWPEWYSIYLPRFADRKKLKIIIHPAVTYEELLNRGYREKGLDPAAAISSNSDYDNAKVFIDELRKIIDGTKERLFV
jgi:1-acyl-sn-glycerol-3-phosphate acyltransferase